MTGSVNSASGEGATVTNTVTSPAQMNPGDIYQVVLSANQKRTIDLSGVSSGAQFELAIMNLSAAGSSSTVQVSNDLSIEPNLAVEGEKWEDLSLQDAFDSHLRNVELEIAAELPPPASGSLSYKAASASASVPAVGSTELFKMLGSISGSSSTVNVTGKVYCVTSDLVFYVDIEVERRNPSDLTNSDVQTVCANFQRAFEAEKSMFGSPSDVNGDGHVAILMTPQVNRLGSSQGGIITGFFYANDLYSGNKREMLYVMVPDSNGAYGTTIEKDFALKNLIPAVLPHEMQHAISYNLHVIDGRGTPEESWLNEGLSHLAEDLLGYGIENPSRYAMYLQKPEAYGFVTPYSPGLAERGGAFLFLRYLYEQHSNDASFVSNMLHSGQTGVANIEESYASTDAGFDQFAEFYLRFSVAVLLNDRGISADKRYGFGDRSVSSTGYYQGVCTVCDADDNRNTALNGVKRGSFSSKMGVSLESAAVQYFQLSSTPSQISLVAPSGTTFGAVLARVK